MRLTPGFRAKLKKPTGCLSYFLAPLRTLTPAKLGPIIACALVSIFLAACGSHGSASESSSPPPPPATGSLTVTVSNAPAGASIVVLGPSGYSQSFNQTTTLNDLAAGSYVVGASTVAGPAGSGSVYVPVLPAGAVAISSGGSGSATVTYSTLSTTWQPMGPRAVKILNGIPAAGKLDALAIDESSPLVTVPASVCTGAACGTTVQIHSTMYVGGGIYNGPGTNSGVYKTADGGQTWTQADNGLDDPAVGALWLDRNNHQTLVAATWTRGLFQSTNGGASWTLTGPYGSSNALLQPVGATTLYAGTGQGIYSSADSGTTWTEAEPTMSPVRALASSGSAIYAGLDDGSVIVQSAPSSQWQSSLPDTAANVTSESIAVNPQNALEAFSVEMAYYNTPDFYVTSNGSSSWVGLTPLDAGGGKVSVQVTAFDPSASAIYIGADVYFGKSTDGGNTWTQMSAPNSASAGAWYDERLIVPAAGGIANHVMVTADQGLYLTPDAGSTWYSLNGNLTSSIAYVAAVHGGTIITTMQDLGPLVSFDGGQTWDSHPSGNPPGSEGGTALINPGNPNYAYVYTAWGFQLSTDGGHNYTYSSTLTGDGFPGCAGNSQIVAVDSQNPAIVYAAAYDCQNTQKGFQQGIYQSGDYGQTWTRQNWPITQPVMVALDPTNDRNIFVGQANGNLEVTHNGGQSWTTVPVGRAEGQTWLPVTLAVNPAAPNVVLVGTSGPPFSGGGVFRSTDGGNTFSPANSGLDPAGEQPWPDSIFRLTYDPSGSGAAIAVRFSGVYLSTDNATSWTSIQANIVPNFFSSAAWDSGYLYVTTFGEGVLRLGGPF